MEAETCYYLAIVRPTGGKGTMTIFAWLPPMTLAAGLMVSQVALTAEGTGRDETASRRTVEQIQRELEELARRARRLRALRTEPVEPEDATVAECRGIGQAREPRVGMSPAVVPQLGQVTAPVLRFDAQPGTKASEQIARCLYMPLAEVGR